MRRHLLYFAMDFKTVLRDRQNRLYAAARLRGDLVCLAGTRQDLFLLRRGGAERERKGQAHG